MSQLVYTIFITNNHNSFHLWSKKNLAKHQNVSTYYDQDCSFTRCFSIAIVNIEYVIEHVFIVNLGQMNAGWVTSINKILENISIKWYASTNNSFRKYFLNI